MQADPATAPTDSAVAPRPRQATSSATSGDQGNSSGPEAARGTAASRTAGSGGIATATAARSTVAAAGSPAAVPSAHLQHHHHHHPTQHRHHHHHPHHGVPSRLPLPDAATAPYSVMRAGSAAKPGGKAPAAGAGVHHGFFGEIYETLKSIFIGMRITAKYWFSPVVTVRYPYEKLSFAPRYRGIHEFAADLCIACEACAKACPVDCIYIDKSGPRKLDKKTGKVTGGELWRYAIDYEKCMFCALCTEVCPTECVIMGKNHDISGYARRDMIVEFAELAKQGLKTPIPLWMERNADRMPWVKAEKERIERGELATREAQIPRL